VGRSYSPGTMPEWSPGDWRHHCAQAWQPATPRCRGACGDSKMSCALRVSMICPAYITATRWAISDTTPMLCVISTSAMLSLFAGCAAVKNLRLNRHVERGGGFVGNQQFGVAGDGHGDHHALVHAADIWSEHVQAALRRRNSHLLHNSIERLRAALLSSPRLQLECFGQLKPTVKQGLRLVVGPEDHRHVFAGQLGTRAARKGKAGHGRQSAACRP